jgi:hypothetical protein
VVWERSGEAGWTVGGWVGWRWNGEVQIFADSSRIWKTKSTHLHLVQEKGRLRAPICILLLGSGRDW